MEINHYKDDDYHGALSLLKSSFGENKTLIINAELKVRLVVYAPDDKTQVIAHAAGYIRDMSCSGRTFIGGVIGDVAVSALYRKQGIAHKLILSIHEIFKRQNVDYSFLFAYDTLIYKSLGYADLLQPITYFDEGENKWNRYVYNGGMYFPFVDDQLDGEISFNGCVY